MCMKALDFYHTMRYSTTKGKGKGRYSSSWEPHLRATGRHLTYGITQCYLPLDTSECAPPNPSHAGWYSIYLPQRDRRLSWPSWLDSAPAGSRTSDLSIKSPMLNHSTTKTTRHVFWAISASERIFAQLGDLKAVSQASPSGLDHELLHHQDNNYYTTTTTVAVVVIRTLRAKSSRNVSTL